MKKVFCQGGVWWRGGLGSVRGGWGGSFNHEGWGGVTVAASAAAAYEKLYSFFSLIGLGWFVGGGGWVREG